MRTAIDVARVPYDSVLRAARITELFVTAIQDFDLYPRTAYQWLKLLWNVTEADGGRREAKVPCHLDKLVSIRVFDARSRKPRYYRGVYVRNVTKTAVSRQVLGCTGSLFAKMLGKRKGG